MATATPKLDGPAPLLGSRWSSRAKPRRGLAALFGHNWAGNGFFVVALVIGFFHGWLKLHYPSPLMTFAFDIPVGAAMAATLLPLPSSNGWFPDSLTGNALKVFVGVAAFYLIAPFGVPLLVGLSAFRAWVFIPMTYLLGYHLVRSIRQAEFYLLLVVALGVATAIYGSRQTPAEVQRMMELDPNFRARMVNTFYASKEGVGRLRVFSTFVSAGAFGSMMALMIVVAATRFVVPGGHWRSKAIGGIAAMIMAYGLWLTAARTALIMLVMGMLLVAWGRRNLLQLAPLPILAYVAYRLFFQSEVAGNLDRYSAVLDRGTVWGRFYIVLAPSLENLSSYPLGGGLGRAAHGLPFVLNYLKGQFECREVDGDMGRLAVEMGFVGLFIFANLMIAGSREALRLVTRWRNTPIEGIALPCGAIFLVSVAMIPTGSPFVGIPHGALLWFCLGAAERMAADYTRATDPDAPDTPGRWVNPLLVPASRPNVPVDAGFGAPTHVNAPVSPPPPVKRFLFSRGRRPEIPIPKRNGPSNRRR